MDARSQLRLYRVMEKNIGSCLCQKVQYEVTGDFSGFFLCHCSRCRKETGSAHASNLFIKTGDLKWINGQELVKNYQVPNTRFTTAFCSECGSTLPSVNETTGRILVPAGSLDNEIKIKANAHIFMGSRAHWEDDIKEAPQFDELPH